VLLCFPGSQDAAQEDEFADVIGVVIRHLQRLAQQALTFAVGKGREQIRRGTGNQFPHGFVTGPERGDAFLPGVRIWRFGFFGPVAGGPVGRNVFGIAAEFEHVPLG